MADARDADQLSRNKVTHILSVHDSARPMMEVRICVCVCLCVSVCVPLFVSLSVYILCRSVYDISESSHILTPICSCGHWLDYFVLKLNLLLCPLWTSCGLMEKASLLCPCCIACLPFFSKCQKLN